MVVGGRRLDDPGQGWEMGWVYILESAARKQDIIRAAAIIGSIMRRKYGQSGHRPGGKVVRLVIRTVLSCVGKPSDIGAAGLMSWLRCLVGWSCGRS